MANNIHGDSVLGLFGDEYVKFVNGAFLNAPKIECSTSIADAYYGVHHLRETTPRSQPTQLTYGRRYLKSEYPYRCHAYV